MQTGSSGSRIGWKSGQTTYFPLRDRMEGAWLWTPDSLDDVIQVLFFHKMPGYILVLVNPKDYKNLLWPHAAVQWSLGEPGTRCQCHVHRCRSSCTAVTLSGPWQLPWLLPLRGKQTSHTKSSHHPSPTTAPARGSRNCNSDSWCFYHTPFRNPPGSSRQTAHTSKRSRPAKNFTFLHVTHLVGDNGKTSPNFCLFLRTKFWVDFLLAVVATPLLGMDFLTKFGLSIIPSK